MKKKWIGIGSFIFLLLLLWLIRVIWFNQTYPTINVYEYDMGEIVELGTDVVSYDVMQGYSVRVDSSKIWEYDDFADYYQVDREEVMNSPMPVPDRVYEVTVTIWNAENTETGIALRDWYIQSKDIKCSIMGILFSYANPGIDTTEIALRPNTEKTFHLTYSLTENRFRPGIWDSLEDYPMWLAVTWYPNKKMISITPSI